MAEGELWTHSQCAAVYARMLAKKKKYRSVELAYTATLLHDIGKLVLNSYVSDAYHEVVGLVNEEKITFDEAEYRVFGFSHPAVGGKVAEKWNLPGDLVEAISCHHHPLQAAANPYLTSIVHVADAVTLQMGMGLGVDGLLYPLSREAVDLLEIEENELEGLMAEIVDLLVDKDVLR